MPAKNQARTNWAPRVIVSGGGTGGHIFPAVAIANEIKHRYADAEFLFVGAKGRMEMEKVPKAGYAIEGLPIAGLQRKKWWKNLSLPLKIWQSLRQSKSIIERFRPDLVIGTGGYAGGPVLYAASGLGIPTLILEPNAFAGLANKWLGKRVDKVCIAFKNMDRYFPKEKLVMTGNPVREQMLRSALSTSATALGTDKRNKEILLIGGSQGARTLNRALRASTAAIAAHPETYWTWQCGALYIDEYKDCETARLPNVEIKAFIDRMDEAYGQADLVIGRAGAITIAELTYLGKASILVPSPNVAEDHQTVNAKALEKEGATVIIRDADAQADLVSSAISLVADSDRLGSIAQAAKSMGRPGAVARIVDEAINLIPVTSKTVAV
ncbi:MAG: undecaprenyldiphospho-muramoylpentapeptide beta-N-acetylglucosaminyltransferase [Bacteroidota bacterium]